MEVANSNSHIEEIPEKENRIDEMRTKHEFSRPSLGSVNEHFIRQYVLKTCRTNSNCNIQRNFILSGYWRRRKTENIPRKLFNVFGLTQLFIR